MRDFLFYPITLLLGVGIVAWALSFAESGPRFSESDVLARGYGASGDALRELTAAPGTEVVVNGGVAQALALSAQGDVGPSAGVFLLVPPSVEAAFGGREVEVAWRLRRPSGSARVQIGYFTAGAGDSGWRAVTVGPEWEEHTLRFRPAPPSTPGYDYIGLWPSGGEAATSPVEIAEVRARVVGG